MENSKGDDQQVVETRFDKFLPKNDEVLIEEHETDGIIQPMTDSLVTPPKTKKSWFKKPWVIVILVLLLIFITIGAWLGIVAKMTYDKVGAIQMHITATSTAFASRDLALAESELANTKTALADAKKTFASVGPLRYVPLLGSYLKDVDHIFVAGEKGTEIGDMVIAAIKPYADIMGFSGTEVTDLGLQTAEDRIIFVATTVEKIAPQMDQISAKLKEVSTEFQAINEKDTLYQSLAKCQRKGVTLKLP
jgi:hypothetical protein